MDKSLLVKIIGFRTTLFHWDTLVLDRWLWLKNHLPKTLGGKKLLDIGCGTGAFSIGAGKRGYDTLGLSWDERNQAEASKRAKLCGVPKLRFNVCDIRHLDQKKELVEQYDYAICFEAIEHIVDDFKLMQDISNCLKPGGRLLLTTPNYHFRAMTYGDNGGADLEVEDGGHVRRGYSKAMLVELCESADLVCEEISFCSGFLSQKTTQLMRKAAEINHLFGWALILPMRLFIPLFDKWVTSMLSWPLYSICLEAYKPRANKDRVAESKPISPPRIVTLKSLPSFVTGTQAQARRSYRPVP